MLKKTSSDSQIDKLGGLAESAEAMGHEFRKRKHAYNEITVSKGAVPDFQAKGWIVLKEQKTGFKLRQDKSHDENLENRFWCCLYRLGYSDLNIGRQFRISLNPGGSNVQKLIDVFAKDDETVVVAECKTAETNKIKSLQLDLGEFDSLKKSISQAIRKHYGSTFKPKIIWCFVTEQIEWAPTRRKCARPRRALESRHPSNREIYPNRVHKLLHKSRL